MDLQEYNPSSLNRFEMSFFCSFPLPPGVSSQGGMVVHVSNSRYHDLPLKYWTLKILAH
jgi:hypothetical protein